MSEHRGGAPARVGATISGFEDLFAAVRAGRAVAAPPASVVSTLPWTDLVSRPVTDLAPATLAVCQSAGDARPLVEAFVRHAVTAASIAGSD